MLNSAAFPVFDLSFICPISAVQCRSSTVAAPTPRRARPAPARAVTRVQFSTEAATSGGCEERPWLLNHQACSSSLALVIPREPALPTRTLHVLTGVLAADSTTSPRPATASRLSLATATSFVDDTHQAGDEVKALSVTSYERSTLHATFAQIHVECPGAPIRVAVYYAAETVLDVTEEDQRSKVNTNRRLVRLSTLAFNALDHNEVGKRVLTSILDGHISTDRSKARLGDKCDEWSTDEDRLESIACEELRYLYIANQDRSVWTFGMNFSAVHERW
ncbi:hypothetical protein EXIGLDRAFT_691457 [Exidia glandulosa HHB12029]|uniref:Uncharacterized protein n=1 Tax=Exidia glandulosa HHB12029 TaxID=1314781 RepID=A0A165ILR9_EXIGL|nr:hypothetical protein EXIGLDRAFT_691457 [Exidia glandulosa HHB12029]